MTRRHPLLYVLFFIMILVALLAPATAAQGWANGEGNLSSYGGHDWIVSQAVRLAGGTSAVPWLVMSTALAACDDPDYTGTPDANHNYHPTVVPPDTTPVPASYGTAPDQVKLYYAQVKTYVAAGNKSAASKALGILAHYYADVCNPLHTDNYYTEGFTHNRYELKVDTLTRSATTNASWAVLDGLDPVIDADAAKTKTMAAAVLSHPSYRTLYTTYKSNGYNTVVATITKSCLGAAANGLADIIAGLK